MWILLSFITGAAIISCIWAISSSHKKSENCNNRVGTLIVDLSDNDRDIYRLEFEKPPGAIEEMKYVIFDVQVLR